MKLFRRSQTPEVVMVPISPLQFAGVGRRVAEAFTEYCQPEEKKVTLSQIEAATSHISRETSVLIGRKIQVYCGRFPYRGDDGVVRDTISLAFKPKLMFHDKPVLFRVERDGQE